MTQPLTEGSLSGLSHRHLHSGKVRELYAVGDDLVLMVATDRISAFDYVLPTEIADKGAVLTALTLWWFEQLSDVVPNHVVTASVADYPAELAPHGEALRGRSMLCRRLDMVAVECVARGYLTGGGLTEYASSGAVCGVPLPSGLVDGSRLPEPIFTPATKAELGDHDENVTFEQVATTIGADAAATLRDLTLAIYSRAEGIARERGVLLADTKLEFGLDEAGRVVLGDEVLTPDSSRFWAAERWSPGGAQPSFDKQIVRDWLTSPASGWDRGSDTPPPGLPDDVVARTRDAYLEAYRRLTGADFT